MSVPPSRAPRPFAKLAPHAWWLLLLLALGLIGWATERRIARVEAITNLPTWSADAPARDAASPTGFAHGERTLIVPGHHNPSFWWIMEAQQSAQEGRLRLRHIDYDARPAGRDLRRTAPYRWWLIAVGWLHGAINGEPLGYAIARGSLVADPLLLALLVIIGAIYCTRYFGPFAAAGFVVGGISLVPLAAGFQPGAPDPHSLAWVLALGSVLPLLVPPQKVGTHRRVHFVVAGIFGGLAFWNGATTQTPVLLAIFLGAVGYELVRSRGSPRPDPAPWRAWALAGALTTLAASAFEFAPNHFSWSLDAVNPVQALTWWGLGEGLRAAGICAREGRRAFGWRALTLLGLAGMAIAAWPVVGILTDSGGLLATDFYARQLANDYHGVLAANLGAWLRLPGGSGPKWATLLPGVLCLVLLVRIFLHKTDWEARGRLVFALLAAVFVAILAIHQLRWWNLFDVLALAGFAALMGGIEADAVRSWMAPVAVLLVLPGLFVGFPPAVTGNAADHLSRADAQELIERDFAYWLNQRRGLEPEVLFSTPVFSSAAAFFGGFDVVDSADHTNKIGLLTAIQLASANTGEEISILVHSRGITHVALPLWDGTFDEFVRIGLGLPPGKPLPPTAFVDALRAWAIPSWMRPMEYVIPNTSGFRGLELRVFAVQTAQPPDLRFSRLADFFLESGHLRAAQAVAETLKAYPYSVSALGAIANVQLARHDRDGLEVTLTRLIPYLSRSWARRLPADRRISLAALFIQTNHADLARQQLTACMQALDAKAVRALPTGAIVQLVALSRVLGVPFPTQGLEAAALKLIPLDTRARLLQR